MADETDKGNPEGIPWVINRASDIQAIVDDYDRRPALKGWEWSAVKRLRHSLTQQVRVNDDDG